MRRLKVSFTYLKLPRIEKIEFGRNVVIKMNDNENFQSPDVPLEEMTQVNDALEAAVIDSFGGGKLQYSNAVIAEREWNKKCRLLGIYVERICDGMESKILSSGFNTTRRPERKGRMDLCVKQGTHSGTVILTHVLLERHSAWLWQYCADPLPADDKGWIWAGGSLRAKFEIKGLEPDKRYWFRACMVTSQGMHGWGMPMMLRV